MFADIVNFIVETISSLGYIGIFILMFLESTVVPVPSEVVMIPAGYLAHKGEMNIYIVILLGVLGSLGGALFNYFFALKFGKRFLLKYGKYFFVSPETIEKTEVFFKNHGHISTFSGRLIPGLRHYISLPAGLAKMNLFVFCLYTSLGATIWVVILTLLGYYLGDNEALVKEYLRYLIIGLLISLAILGFWYYRKVKKSKL
ncbi:DedA family protein [Aliarcobacter cibarius]|jgi:membrane protein DedA with SNARE-associated domain|uniref:DedA family membrane protein, type II (SNARE domain) n=1 Tax=Aliarcobacter cibarius TaxID=255507 RepID=A0A5J6RJQ6_9BACT|nr:DedA family protein [Aliarcobacter cibarius]QEZ88461.1 DedA family membrane protein, type II (SNARE domain) [Aliarcobacter cibarius]QKJ26472.1 DedA family membrane protein, type II (SNARE domain) [Aliarcobacter cibarius]TLT01959.1 DedA family protein [Aliarcobacter cibarius]TLT02294.1 DedA family protein [Aliarcobacter cibarius]TLT04725.1 DedA family protein [Aliarcobacter cibarius]